MNKTKSKITFLASYELKPNMISVLSNYGEMLSKNFELQLITGSMDNLPENIKQYYKIYTYPEVSQGPYELWFAFLSLIKFLRSETTDILINVCKPLPLGLAVALVGKLAGFKTIIRETGDICNEKNIARGFFKKTKKWIIYDILMVNIFKLADQVITVGEKIEQEFLKKRFSPKKVQNLPQPFIEAKFKPLKTNKSELKESLGLKSNKTTLLYVGKICWNKGSDRLVRLIKNINEINSKYQFCIVGKGPDLNKFEDFIENEVKLAGFISRNKIHQYYQAADLFVYPTRSDGLPNVILEALSSALPILATPVGEIPYIVKETHDFKKFEQYILKGKYEKEDKSRIEYLKYEKVKSKYLKLLYGLV